MTVPFFKPSFSQDEYDAVKRVLDSGWLTTGKEALAFEEEFSEAVSCEYALAVNSATSGLWLSMEALGITSGTKLLTTPYTFASTATCALHLGAEVVYADVIEDSYLIDPNKIEALLKKDKSVKAIIPVHIAGEICDIKALQTLSEKYSVAVIEDAAHAFPSKTEKGFAGTFFDAGVFSFYATKTITTGEGGMVCTNRKDIAERMMLMRSHGINRPIWNRYTDTHASWEYNLSEAGYKFNLPDILAAIGRAQLQKAQNFLTARKKIAQQYTEVFSQYPYFIPPLDSEGHAWHLYLLQIDPQTIRITKNEFGKKLQDAGIGISLHFIPHSNFTFFQKKYNLNAESFPNAQRQFERTLTLPLWVDMPQAAVDYVIQTVIEIAKKYAR